MLLPPQLPYFETLKFIDESNHWVNQHIAWLSTHKVHDAGLVYEHAMDWLLEQKENPNNFKNFRSELTTFFAWAWDHEGIALDKIRRPDLNRFMLWCENPPVELIDSAQRQHFNFDKALACRVPNPAWRPFVKRLEKNSHMQPADQAYRLSISAKKTKLSVLSMWYQYLNAVDYCDSNPPALMLQRAKYKDHSQSLYNDEDNEQIKSFSELQWSYLVEVLDDLVEADPAVNCRTRFMLLLLYAAYPRISEIAARPGYAPIMSQFRRDNKTGSWGFFIPRSKGGKSRTVAVSDALLSALAMYRKHLGLPAQPSPNETTPLFVRHRKAQHGRDAGILNANLGIRQIRTLVQKVFDLTEEKLNTDGLFDDANEVSAFTVHAIRHTGISHDINLNRRPLTHIKDDAGHDSIETTSKYIWTRRVERHLSAKGKSLDRLMSDNTNNS